MRTKGFFIGAALAAFCVVGVFALLQATQAREKEQELRRHVIELSISHSRTHAQVQELDETIEERIVDLPEDAAGWYFTLFTSGQSTERERRVYAWLTSEPRLATLVAQTRYNVYRATDKIYQTRYAGQVGSDFPVVVLQRPDGKVCYKCSGANLPETARELAEHVAQAIKDCCPFPRPTPTPAPTPPAPTPTPDLPPIPDITPDQPDEQEVPADDKSAFYIALLVAMAAGGAFGVWNNWRKESV